MKLELAYFGTGCPLQLVRIFDTCYYILGCRAYQRTNCSCFSLFRTALFESSWVVWKFNHISLERRELHWIPVADRITFKILVFTQMGLYKQTQYYLCSLAHKKSEQKQRLRPSDQDLLAIPRSKLVTCGDRTFS